MIKVSQYVWLSLGVALFISGLRFIFSFFKKTSLSYPSENIFGILFIPAQLFYYLLYLPFFCFDHLGESLRAREDKGRIGYLVSTVILITIAVVIMYVTSTMRLSVELKYLSKCFVFLPIIGLGFGYLNASCSY